MSHVTVLAGGLDSAKFLAGLVDVLPEEDVHAVVNVGDDDEVWGLHISPDIDYILNALAGELDSGKSWERGQTYQCYSACRKLGLRARVRVGDRDLATHLLRTELLRAGRTLDQATSDLAARFGLGLTIRPATNDRLRTRVATPSGACSVAEFYGSEALEAVGVDYEGSESAAATTGVLESIMTASRVILAPADPVRSLDAILAVPGIRDALVRTEAGVVAVSPVVGSQSIIDGSARLDDLLRVTGSDTVSARSFAERYKDFLDHVVIHTSDLPELDSVRATGLGVWVENILVSAAEDAARLAQRVTNEQRAVTSRA